MSDTFTTFLSLTKPEIGASDDTWGDKLNDNFDTLDALFATTGEGTIVVRDASDFVDAVGVKITKAAGNARITKFMSGTSLRWDIGADATAESGSNAGSKFKLNRYSDAAGFLGSPIIVDRDTGLLTFETTPKVGSNTILHAGNSSHLVTPISQVSFIAGSVAPTYYLLANGASYLRASYPDLFTAIGTTFGAVDSDHFNVPNIEERVIIGKAAIATLLTGQTGGINSGTVGNTGGEAGHALLIAELALHDHDAFIHELAHHHDVTTKAATSVFAGGGASGAWQNTTTGQTADATTGVRVKSSSGGSADDKTGGKGSGTAHNTVQPSIILYPIIRALAS